MMLENIYIKFKYIDTLSEWQGSMAVVTDSRGGDMHIVYHVKVRGDYTIDRWSIHYSSYEEADKNAKDCVKLHDVTYDRRDHMKLLEGMVDVIEIMNADVAIPIRKAYYLDKPVEEIVTYEAGKSRVLDAEKYYDYMPKLKGVLKADTLNADTIYVSPTMDGSHMKSEAVVKTVNVMDAEEFDKHIDSILKYNGLIYELRNEFDKLKDTKGLTDDQVRVLMLNKMLQKLLDTGMSPLELIKMKQENEYYKKSCEDLLEMREKDSDEYEKLKLKLKMQ